MKLWYQYFYLGSLTGPMHREQWVRGGTHSFFCSFHGVLPYHAHRSLLHPNWSISRSPFTLVHQGVLSHAKLSAFPERKWQEACDPQHGTDPGSARGAPKLHEVARTVERTRTHALAGHSPPASLSLRGSLKRKRPASALHWVLCLRTPSPIDTHTHTHTRWTQVQADTHTHTSHRTNTNPHARASVKAHWREVRECVCVCV